MARLREAVDRATCRASTAGDSLRAAAAPVFKQYRADSSTSAGDGERVLLRSAAFDAPRDAGQRVARQQGRLGGADASITRRGVGIAEVDAALAARRWPPT
jgi:tryptophanyl-tRNA synthetase